VVFSQVEGRPLASNAVEPVFDDALGGGLVGLGMEEGGENGKRVVTGRLLSSRGKDGTETKGASGSKACGLLHSGFLLVIGWGGGGEDRDEGEEGEGDGTFCTF
jgi:hypothetical protein